MPLPVKYKIASSLRTLGMEQSRLTNTDEYRLLFRGKGEIVQWIFFFFTLYILPWGTDWVAPFQLPEVLACKAKTSFSLRADAYILTGIY